MVEWEGTKIGNYVLNWNFYKYVSRRRAKWGEKKKGTENKSYAWEGNEGAWRFGDEKLYDTTEIFL